MMLLQAAAGFFRGHGRYFATHDVRVSPIEFRSNTLLMGFEQIQSFSHEVIG